jgi:hypothetical protein
MSRCISVPQNTGLGAHFNLEIGMLEQLKGRTFKILKNRNLENYKLENQNLEKQKS